MKRFITAILAMTMLLGLFGCGQAQTSPENGKADSAAAPDLGIAFEAVNVTATGMTLRCTQSGGKAEGELTTGSYYRLEVKKNGKWEAVKPLAADVVWTAEAWLIPMNDTAEWAVDWSWLYGELPVGSYRIVKNIMDFRGTGDYSEYEYYAEFAVVD